MRQRYSNGLIGCFLALAIWGCSAGGGGNTGTVRGSGPQPEEETRGTKRRGSVMLGPVNQGRYRLDSRDSLAMEMPDGSFQRTVTVKAAFLTMTLRPGGANLIADISLDSMVLDRPNSLVQPLVDSARGTRFQGVVKRTGHLDSLIADRSSVFGEQLRAMLQRLLPIVPDSGAEPGDQWQDSTAMPYQIMAGFEATEQRVAEFRAGKWAEVNGTRALVIHSVINYTVTGSGSGFGQEIRFEGSGRADGVHHLTPAGVLLDAQVSDSVKMTLSVPAVGQTVPTVVVTSYSLRPLP